MKNQKIQHTPAPWRHAGLGLIVAGGGENSTVIADCRDDTACRPSNETELANARLIAASPDLLAACLKAIAYIDDTVKAEIEAEKLTEGNITAKECIMESLSEAIARATGGE